MLGCLVLLLGAQAVEAAPAGQSAEEQGRSAQRLAQVVDYVAADYGGAVRDGQVIDASEWNEQRELLADGLKLLPGLLGSDEARTTLSARFAAVVQAVEQKAAPAEVQRLCRAVRQTLKDSFKLHMVPAGPVDPVVGARLFGTLCASCHGATGHADTPTAAALKPPPVSFHDAQRMAKIAPSLAFHTLTFGVANTAMAPFDHLPAQERWDLAFYVVALRHGVPGASAPPPAFLAGPLLARLSAPAVLADLSDEEVSDELSRSGLTAIEEKEALDYLRATASFASERVDVLAQAKKLVTESLQAAQRGDFVAAHRAAIAAYLDGIEPHEAALRIERPELLARIEAAFAALRQVSDPDRSPSAAAVARQAQAITALLADAESAPGGNATEDSAKAFLAAMIIALREGMEVALLIAALLAFLRKSGQAALARSVHVGWMLSIPAGLLSFVLVGKLVDGARRELAEGVLTLFAAAILLSVTHWVLGAKEARHWLGFLRRRVEAVGQHGQGAADHRKQMFWLAGIAFFASFREALETALFYRALLLDVGPQGWRQVLLGIVAGIAALAVVVVVLGRIGRKLNPRPVMLASSALLALLALALTGHGIHALQEGGYIGMSLIMLGSEAWSGIPALGIYPTWQGLGAQLAVLALLLLPSLLEKIKTARAAGSAS